LSKTLEYLRTTQEELIQSEKMAALGQLIAGIAHEINTPLGAIRSSVGNISYFLEQVLEQLPDFFHKLSVSQRENFFVLLHRALEQKVLLSAKEERKIKRAFGRQLEEKNIASANNLADILIDMRVYSDIEMFLPLLEAPENVWIFQVAYQLSGLQRSAQTISTATDRASKIVFALKNYARYDHSGEKAFADVVEGIETVLTLYHNQLKQGVEVIRHYEPLPLIACYPDELNQVWTNLIHNALQAIANKGILTMEVKIAGKQIEIRIIDSGKGIPAAILSKIFEPFFTTKPAGEGSGLGLDIVKKIINKHNGHITVESEPGRTCFTVSLPIEEGEIVHA
jgi:signal transduction histidine kinase